MPRAKTVPPPAVPCRQCGRAFTPQREGRPAAWCSRACRKTTMADPAPVYVVVGDLVSRWGDVTPWLLDRQNYPSPVYAAAAAERVKGLAANVRVERWTYVRQHGRQAVVCRVG